MNEPHPVGTGQKRPLTIVYLTLVFIGALLLVLLFGAWLLLSGTSEGTRLVYEVDGKGSAEMVVRPIQQRLYGLPGTRVRVQAVDERRVEVLVASRNRATLDAAKSLIESAGVLRFLIVATPAEHASLIGLATQQASSDNAGAGSRDLHDPQGMVVGRWVTVARSDELEQNTRPLRVDVSGSTLRRADTGAIVDLPTEVREADARIKTAQWMDQQGIGSIEVLMAVDPKLEVGGSDLDFVVSSFDQTGTPAINFNLTGKGSARFFALTTAYAPRGQQLHQLGIVLDDVLLSAPVIRSPVKGQAMISGDFTQAEVDMMTAILRAGQLPVNVREVPGSEAPVEMPSRLSDIFR